jgi:hypothetical protein
VLTAKGIQGKCWELGSLLGNFETIAQNLLEFASSSYI